MMLIESGCGAAVLAESQRLGITVLAAIRLSGQGAYHCGHLGSGPPEMSSIFDLHQLSKPIVRYYHSAGWCAEGRL